MTVKANGQPVLTVHSLPPAPRPASCLQGPLTGAQIVLVHGFASTPLYNWERTRWVSLLQAEGASVHLITLPYHQLSDRLETVTASYQLAQEQVRNPLHAVQQSLTGFIEGLEGDIHLIGYSLGARICWSLAAHSSQLCSSLVAGAMPVTNHLAALHHALQAGRTLPDDFEHILKISPLPEKQLKAFLALASGALALDPPPSCPVLFFRGDRDSIASRQDQAFSLLKPGQANWLEYPGRDHISILTSRKLRAAVVEFMVRHRP